MRPLDRSIPNLLFNGSFDYEVLGNNVLIGHWAVSGSVLAGMDDNVQGTVLTLNDGAEISQAVELLMTVRQTVSFYIVGGTGRLRVSFGSVSGKYLVPAYAGRVVALKASEEILCTISLRAEGGTVSIGEVGIYPGHHQDPHFSHHPAEHVLPIDTYILWEGDEAPPGYVFVDTDDLLLIQGIIDPHRGGGLLPGGSAQHAHVPGTEWGNTDYTMLSNAETVDVPNTQTAQLFAPLVFNDDASANIMWYQHRHRGLFIHEGLPKTAPYRLCRKVGR